MNDESGELEGLVAVIDKDGETGEVRHLMTRRTLLARGSVVVAGAALVGCPTDDDDDATTDDDDDATADDDDATADDDDTTPDDDDATPDDDDATPDDGLPDAPGLHHTAELIQPNVLAADSGALAATLTFGLKTWELGLPVHELSADGPTPRAVQMRGYTDETNIGSAFGPTLKLRAGDDLSILLVNDLGDYTNTDPVPRGCTEGSNDCDNVPADVAERGHNYPHDLNDTNLHTHGLQVSPQCPSDYIFNTVLPGDSFQYEYGSLPDGVTTGDYAHTAGTYWYHAHKHGRVAAQMYGGGIGFILVEGALDDYLREPIATGGLGLLEENELVLGFCDLLVGALPADPADPATLPDLNLNALTQADLMQWPQGSDGQYDATGERPMPQTLINGQATPALLVDQNTLYRLRILNGRVADPLRLELYPIDDDGNVAYDPDSPGGPMDPNAANRIPAWNTIAFDGLTLPAPVLGTTNAPPQLYTAGQLKLAPANRADVLLQLADPGWYAMVDGTAVGRSNPQQIMGYIYVRASEAVPVPIPVVWNPLNPHFPVVEDRIADTSFETTGSNEVWFQIRHNSAADEGCDSCPEPGASGITPGPMMTEYFEMWNPANTPGISPPDATTPKDGAGNLLWPGLDDTPDLIFSGDRLDFCLVQDSADEWTVYNYSTMMHPFHIHVNPFFVTEHGHEGVPTPPGTPNRWQDTVPVPSARFDAVTGAFIGPGYAKFKTRYLNWTGDFVAHCHKVNHEDIGMMMNIRVAPSTGGDLSCPTDPYAPDPAVPYIAPGAPEQCD